jgi:hypothetical protein
MPCQTQETQAIQNEELAKVKPTDFKEGLAIISTDGESYRLKYMYDPICGTMHGASCQMPANSSNDGHPLCLM